MNNFLFGIGIYGLAYVICFKPGLFNTFEMYRKVIARVSLEKGWEWIINLAVCPLCVGMLLSLMLCWVMEGSYLVSFIISMGGIFFTHKLIDKD